MKMQNFIKAAMGVFSTPNILKSRYQIKNQTAIKNLRYPGPSSDEFNLRDIECFMGLVMGDGIIQQFLEFDRCNKLADKYLLSLVFVYFIRARLDHSEYTRINFFAALYLAHDIEEEDESLKIHVARWGLPRLQKDNLEYFLTFRDSLWIAMDFRAGVSAECSLQVMNSKMDSPLWKRHRSPAHSGAWRVYMPEEECSNCRPEVRRFYCTDPESDESDKTSDEDEVILPPAKKLRLWKEE